MKNIAAKRLGALPPYLFVEVDRRRREALAAGRDVIDFGVGDPDLPTPQFICDKAKEAIDDPANHSYPFGAGVREFRLEIEKYLQNRFGVTIDPDNQVAALIGTKEGLGHLPLAVVDPGDVVLIPQPAYPVYRAATIFVGGMPYIMDLTEQRDWLPDLNVIPQDVARKAKLMFLNYPNNPTAAVAPPSFFEEVVAFARRHEIIIAHDAPYTEIYFDKPPHSILEVDGADQVAVEFHSLSKTFNMTGWRLGFVAGRAEVVSALTRVKANMDSGQFKAIQWAGCEALRRRDAVEVTSLIERYRARRDWLVPALRSLGLQVNPPEATFYIWAKVPPGHDSMSFAGRILDEAAIVVVPGIGLGETGKDYIRLSLTVPDERIKEAVSRLEALRL